MKASATLSNNTHDFKTLTGILPAIRQLSSLEKLKLIRILADDLGSKEHIFPLEQDKIYFLPTPYETFGAGEILINTLKTSDLDNDKK